MLFIIVALCVALPTLLGLTLPTLPLGIIVVIAAVWNLMAWRDLMKSPEAAATQLFVCSQLVFDLVVLSAIFFLTGGATNPMVFLLLPPVAVAATTLPPRWVAGVAFLAVAAYSLLSISFMPLALGDPKQATALHLGGMWATFIVSVILIAWWVSRLVTLVRERDAALAAAREQDLRNQRIMALGTLAASTAHELGTPLATLVMLVDELQHTSSLDAEATEDLILMRGQLDYCKRAITRLTEAAGAPRDEMMQRMFANDWLQTRFSEWRTLRRDPPASLQASPGGPVIVVDRALDHGLFNLLDNALRAGPPVEASIEWSAQEVTVSILDHGPGFSPEALERAASYEFASHAEGSGIGLILTRAAVERLGGHITLSNAESGAQVRLHLPVAIPTDV